MGSVIFQFSISPSSHPYSFYQTSFKGIVAYYLSGINTGFIDNQLLSILHEEIPNAPYSYSYLLEHDSRSVFIKERLLPEPSISSSFVLEHDRGFVFDRLSFPFKPQKIDYSENI